MADIVAVAVVELEVAEVLRPGEETGATREVAGPDELCLGAEGTGSLPLTVMVTRGVEVDDDVVDVRNRVIVGGDVFA